jgi:hypothetical protein
MKVQLRLFIRTRFVTRTRVLYKFGGIPRVCCVRTAVFLTSGRGASAPGKAREAAEGGFLSGGDACPVNDTVQNPFRDVMAQRGMCSDGRAPHSLVSLGGAKGGAAVALHGRGVGGQHAEAEAVVETGADFPALEFKSRTAGESFEPRPRRSGRGS